MTTFADSLKKEIARIARKELRDEIAALRKGFTGQRLEVSSLKKQVKALLTKVGKLEKMRPAPVGDDDAEQAGVKRGRKAHFTAERLIAQRERLGFTQVQMGQLLGVSSLTIWKWETGHMPRESKVPALIQQMSLGKREALAQIAAKS